MRANIGNDVCICGGGWIYGRGQLSIGDETWFSPGTVFFTHENAYIRIGKKCDVGPCVRFVLGSHEIAGRGRRAGEGTAKSIFVGDGCWIGGSSTILGGVTIGAGSVIAAGSLVREDVPENSLVAGVPAKVKRQLVP